MKSTPLPEETGISRKKSSVDAEVGMVTFCSIEPSSGAKMPPNQTQKLPVRGPLPPPKPQLPSQIGVPKLLETSLHAPPPGPASKLPSATKFVVQEVLSPW